MKLIAALILIALLGGCYGKAPEKTGLEGTPLPFFQLLLQDSATYFNTNSIPDGKPIVLFFFGPNCPYSRAQMEEIIEDIASLKDIRFYIFTTSSFLEMKEFYEHYQLKKYPNIAMGFATTDSFADYFEVQGVPYMAIYGKDKRLNKSFIGKVYGRQIKRVAEE